MVKEKKLYGEEKGEQKRRAKEGEKKEKLIKLNSKN